LTIRTKEVVLLEKDLPEIVVTAGGQFEDHLDLLRIAVDGGDDLLHIGPLASMTGSMPPCWAMPIKSPDDLGLVRFHRRYGRGEEAVEAKEDHLALARTVLCR